MIFSIYTPTLKIKTDRSLSILKREYWIILFTYIAMQLLGFVGLPALTSFWMFTGKTVTEAQMLAVPTWLLLSFTVALGIILFLLRKEIKNPPTLRNEPAAPVGTSIFWAISGIFLAFFAQAVAVNLEQLFGIRVGSENTEALIGIIKVFPIVIIVTSIVGPILEEIVFRKIIFGALYNRFNFLISALISSVIFAVAHNDLEHTLLYTAMGLTFSFLYVKTKRIIVPIFAHVAMNTFVVLVQSFFYDDLEKLLDEMQQMQSFIGGL